MNTSNYTPEQIKKAKAAKSPEELAALAKEYGIELTTAQAQEYFAKLHPQSGELADEELDNISGGGCSKEENLGGAYAETTTPNSTCDQFENKYFAKYIIDDNHCIVEVKSICKNCKHYKEDQNGKHCLLRENA